VDVEPSDTEPGEIAWAGGGRNKDDIEDGGVDGVLVRIVAEFCPALVILLLEIDLVLTFEGAARGLFVVMASENIRSRSLSKLRDRLSAALV
jgi:hypothetical protein